MRIVLPTVRVLHEASEFLNDAYHAVKTAGYVLQEQAGVVHPDANEYAATPYRVIRRLFRQLPPRCLQGTFIDYGCGRGRVAIMAAGHGFRRVIGIEISETLHSEAQQNVCSARVGRKHVIELLNVDASQFVVPDDTTVVYFYKPFGKPTTCQVARRIEQSLCRNPRELWLLAYNSALLEEVACEHLHATLVHRRMTVYPSIPWAVLRVQSLTQLHSLDGEFQLARAECKFARAEGAR